MEAPDLNLLVTLNALLQEGSVTQAARRLGLSAPAVSHALARLRDQMQDPLLVRAGRNMVLSPKALQLRDRVQDLVKNALELTASPMAFDPHQLVRTFTLYTSDHALLVLGPRLDARLREDAPGVCLRVLPANLDDVEPMRQGLADMSICLLGHLPPEFRSRRLFTDRFVVVGRKGHPGLGPDLTLESYLTLEHGAVSPLGHTHFVDLVLQEQGLSRRLTRIFPFYGNALDLAAQSDLVFTLPERVLEIWKECHLLEVVEPPLVLSPYALNLIWHPRSDRDPAHQWLRDLLVEVAAETAPEFHDGARGDFRRPTQRKRKKT